VRLIRYSWLDLAIWVVALALLVPILMQLVSDLIDLVTCYLE
jgi:hypothetical protein